MQLFELVSPRLFRPLAGPNRAFYAELLLLLWEECRHTADYSISRAEAVWRAEDYFAALAKPLALDADGAGDEEEQPTRDPHTLAVGFLLRLRRTGWLEEQPGSYEGEASLAFAPEVTPLLEALEEILNPRVVTYTGKLYKAWQLLGSIGQEKSPYENVLREVDADLDALNRSLRALNASIGHYIDRQGVVYTDEDGDLVTSIVNGKDCVFTCYDERGYCYCALEKAYREGKSSFYKPLSCHLYPIRLKKIGDCVALNYHRWDVCKMAVMKGGHLNLPVYRFLKEPLIRRFGEEWYTELESAVKELKEQGYLE